MADESYIVRTVYETETRGATANVAALGDAFAEVGRSAAIMQERAQAAVKVAQASAQQALNVHQHEQKQAQADAQARLNVHLHEQGKLEASNATAAKAAAQDRERFAGSFVIALNQAVELAQKLYGAISSVVGKIMDAASHAEDTRIAVAGLMQANKAADTAGPDGFAHSMDMSATLIAQMKKDARDLPGEFQDLMNVMRGGGMVAGLHAGKSVMDAERMSARMMAMGAAAQMPSDVVGREFGMMMEGRAASHNALWMKLKDTIGLTSEQFNALGASEKWAKVDKALQGWDGAIAEFGNTWSAVASATADYGKEAALAFGSPIFDSAKSILKEINDWYDAHREQVVELAREYGEKLAAGIRSAWETAKDIVVVLASLDWSYIATAVEIAAGAWLAFTAIMTAYEAVQWAVNFAMAANPIGLMVLAVVALAAGIALLVAYWDKVAASVDRAFAATAKFTGQFGGAGGAAIFEAKAKEHDERDKLAKEMGEGSFLDRLKRGGKDYTGEEVADKIAADSLKKSLAVDEAIAKIEKDEQAMRSLNKSGKVVSQHHTNIGSVNIHQTVNAAEDPDRVFIDMRKAVEQGIHHPTESSSSFGRVAGA